MTKFKVFLALLVSLLAITLVFTACSSKKEEDESKKDESTYQFPEDGVLKPLVNGKAPNTTDGRNPSLMGDKFVVFFDFAFENAGLDLDENTEISYKAKKLGEASIEGVSKLDTSVEKIKNDYGYIGVCLDIGMDFELYDQASVQLSFKDKSGKEFTVRSMTVFKGLYSVGFSQAKFDTHLGEFVTTSVGKSSIKQTGTVNGQKYSLTIDLSGWAQRTSVNQIITCSRLFWECYPRMYERFGAASKANKDITLAVENTGYEVASATPTRVHLHDGWLQGHPTDFDCLTHEFGHVVQNAWKRGYLEYDADIELFAEYCRYVYAFQNGLYNDDHWSLATPDKESTREKAKRFLVWLDYTYSTEDNDVLLKYFTACKSQQYPTAKWDQAWQVIFAGTDLEGKTIDQVWAIYAASDFARLSTKNSNGRVPLLEKYNVREKVKMFEFQAQ